MISIDDVIDDFEILEDWEDRYRYLIELGQTLEPLDDARRIEANKVRGCVSQVWLHTAIVRNQNAGGPVLKFTGDSDAHIVRGLIAVLLALFSGKRAVEIGKIDAKAVLRKLSLEEHLTPQRSNGLNAMVARIRAEADLALENAQTA